MKKLKDIRITFIISMIMFGTIGLFVRNIGITSGELALYRAILATLLIGAFLLITRQKIPFAAIKKEILLLLFSGAAMGFNWILLFEAYKYTTVSIATLSYIDPPVAVLISVLVLGEKISVMQIIGGGLILGFTLLNEIAPKKER